MRNERIREAQRAERRRRLLAAFRAQLEKNAEREAIVVAARELPSFQLDDEIELREALGLPCYCGRANPDHEGDCARS
jgi:hypothetical protein